MSCPLAPTTRQRPNARPPRPREVIDLTYSPPPTNYDTRPVTPASRKRRADEYDADTNSSKKPESNKKAKGSPTTEKRLRAFRSHAPKTFLQKLERAQTQRMVVVDRRRSGEGTALQEEIDVVGTTGNIYTVTIGSVPRCTCPDHIKGNECKHKVYALSTVLRAPYEYQYQRGLLSNELEEVFANAPPIPHASGRNDKDDDGDGKRKPIEGECPICYMDLDESNNEIVWCKVGCGNNMHKECFSQWAASQRGKEVKCVYCRTPWHRESQMTADIVKNGNLTAEGYVNVADQFGMSGMRDWSAYYQPWVRREFGSGR